MFSSTFWPHISMYALWKLMGGERLSQKQAAAKYISASAKQIWTGCKMETERLLLEPNDPYLCYDISVLRQDNRKWLWFQANTAKSFILVNPVFVSHQLLYNVTDIRKRCQKLFFTDGWKMIRRRTSKEGEDKSAARVMSESSRVFIVILSSKTKYGSPRLWCTITEVTDSSGHNQQRVVQKVMEIKARSSAQSTKAGSTTRKRTGLTSSWLLQNKSLVCLNIMYFTSML